MFSYNKHEALARAMAGAKGQVYPSIWEALARAMAGAKGRVYPRSLKTQKTPKTKKTLCFCMVVHKKHENLKKPNCFCVFSIKHVEIV